MTSYQTRRGFWREAVAIQGSITVHVLPYMFSFGVISSVVCLAASVLQNISGTRYDLDLRPLGFAGAVLGILLVIRLNAGYDRWWEARTIWGGIVNQTRNLVISATTFGPDDPDWQTNIVAWTKVFPHVAKMSLRDEPPAQVIIDLVGREYFDKLRSVDHMPNFVISRIGFLLSEARKSQKLDGFAFQQIDRERALLIDHIGACERILATPLPKIYSITIRRFVLIFLLMLPLALIHLLPAIWLIPGITMLIAYPLLTLDQIGVELENPFSKDSLSHLPLDEITEKIDRNLSEIQKCNQSHNGTEE